jgi:hypothetical protein
MSDSKTVVTFNVSNSTLTAPCGRWLNKEQFLHQLHQIGPRVCSYSPCTGNKKNLLCGNAIGNTTEKDPLNFRCEECKNKQGRGGCVLYPEVLRLCVHKERCSCAGTVDKKPVTPPESPTLESLTQSMTVSQGPKTKKKSPCKNEKGRWITSDAFLQEIMSGPEVLSCSFSPASEENKYYNLFCGRRALNQKDNFWYNRCSKHISVKGRGVNIFMSELFRFYVAKTSGREIINAVHVERTMDSFLEKEEVKPVTPVKNQLSFIANKYLTDLLNPTWAMTNDLCSDKSALVRLVPNGPDFNIFVFGFFDRVISEYDCITDQMVLSLTPITDVTLLEGKDVVLGDIKLMPSFLSSAMSTWSC